MRVLVMGGTQFNGLALVRELVRAGHQVTVLNRGKTEASLPAAVRRLFCDRTDDAAMRETLRGETFDCVADISAYHPEDVELMVELLGGHIGHYIFASSTVIYAPSAILPITEDHPVDRGAHQIEYGLHKILCEDILLREHRQHGFPATIVPFSMVFGPGNAILDREQRMFVRLLAGRPILIPGDGTALGQVGHVDDQARALRMLMGNPATFGKRYNVTGRQWFSDEAYVDTFAEVVGVEPRKVFIPAELMDDLWDGRLHLEEGRRTERLIDARPTPSAQQLQVMYGRRQPLAILIQKLAPNLHRWNSNVVFSTDRLRRDAGWEPDYTFRSMVEQTYGWFRGEGLHTTRQFDFTFEDQLLARLS
ncbi:MAG TPA: SDR family oxidoreductase [Acidimicrobiales bacterium]|nr:SDR family oxidoreductase [Acidimicrobiales bacterium]